MFYHNLPYLKVFLVEPETGHPKGEYVFCRTGAAEALTVIRKVTDHRT